MLVMDRTHLIVSTPGVLDGQTRIERTRMPVADVGMLHENGASIEYLTEQYGLSVEQVEAALDYFKLHREELLEDTRQRDARMRELVKKGVVREIKIS